MVPVGGVPLIGYALALLAHHGITDVVVNTHHLSKVLRELLGNGSQFGVHITYSHEEEILGTGGGLKKMHDYLGDDTFVVINSDTIVDVDITKLVQAHRDQGALATMLLRTPPKGDEYGAISLDSDHRIRRILGHSPSSKDFPQGESLRDFMFTGVHVLEPRFLEYLPPGISTCVVRYGYMKALNNREALYGYVGRGYWADAGTPERYFEATQDALYGRMNLRHIDALGSGSDQPSRYTDESVRLGSNVQIGAAVQLLGPSIIGDGVRIGDRATIGPGSVIGKNVSIGRDAVVSQSVILDGAKVEAQARLHRLLVSRKVTMALG